MRAAARPVVIRFSLTVLKRLLPPLLSVACWAVLGALFAGIPEPAQAQTGTLGWCTNEGAGNNVCGYGSADAACQAHYAYWNGGRSPYLGYEPTGNWHVVKCKWPYSPPIVTAPASAWFDCESGFDRVPSGIGGLCKRQDSDFRGRDGPACAVNNGATILPHTKNPINVLTGSKSFSREDYATADGALKVHRQFNSNPMGGAQRTVVQSPLGFGNWQAGFGLEVQIGYWWRINRAIAVVSPKGATYRFRRNGTTGLMEPDTSTGQPLPQSDYTLEFVGTWPSPLNDLWLTESHWKVRDPEGRVWNLKTFLNPNTGEYDVARPTSVIEPSGVELTYAYDGSDRLSTITDNHGKEISFTWAGAFGSEAITSITLPGGETIDYIYDTITSLAGIPERLIRVEYRDASSNLVDQESYDYGDTQFPSFVTGIRDANNVLRWSVVYDDEGRATSSSGPAGADIASVAYSAMGSTSFTRTVTNAFGRETIYSFSRSGLTIFDPKLTTVSGQATANCVASTGSYTYDTAKMLATQTDEEGRVTKYTRNTRGLPTQVIEAFGTADARTTDYTWHASLPLPTQIVAPGLTTDLVYDTQGRMTSKTETDTTTHTVPYATNGRTRTWTYTWSTSGQLLTEDGPLPGTGDTVTYTYGTDGYLDSVENEVGQVTTVSAVDGRGLPLTIVDPNGVTTTMTYDHHGRVLTTTLDATGSAGQYAFDYDDVGNLTKITLPEGGWLEYEYDTASRLTAVENDRGQRQVITPNVVGDPTNVEIRDASNVLVAEYARAYDELGRVIDAIGAGGQTSEFGYDKLGNLVSFEDARDKLFQTTFDPLNRVIVETDPENETVEYAYNGLDELTLHTDGNGFDTSRKVDGFGRVIEEVSPDRGTRQYWYDLADNLTKVIDGDSEETNYTYDDAGRLLTATYPGASVENLTFTYDATGGGNKGAGRLTGVTDETGSSSFTYDAQGRLTQDAKVIWGASYNVGYGYDDNGEITQITLPSGRTISYARASDGLITGITTKETPGSSTETLVSSASYLPFGPLESLDYGNGLSLARDFDANYWLEGIQVAGSGVTRLDLTYSRNANGQLEGITDHASSGRGAWHGYTDAGRLQYAVGPWSEWNYTYDGAGNMIERNKVVGGTPTYNFLVTWGTANRLGQVQDASATPIRNLSYRLGGDLASDEHVGGDTFDYYYNSRKRLVVAQKNGVDVGWYGYDAFGRRVTRTTFAGGTVATHYIFAPDGKLLAEHDASTGAVIKEYVWLDEMVVAMIDHTGGTAQTYFVHTGHMDEPLVLTDASRAKVWDAYVDPYGIAQTFGAASVEMNLRLPGQYYQAETGLLQNWMRDYDPTLGRYIQTDPIGLAGGQNVYPYVDGRPTDFIDPMGEVPLLVPIVVGALVGMAVDVGFQLLENGGQWDCISVRQVLIAGASGAAVSTLGPTGALLGRGGAKAAQYGFPKQAGALNNNNLLRFGWGYRQRDNKNLFRLGGKMLGKGKPHIDIPRIGFTGGPAAPVRDGVISGAVGGTVSNGLSE